MVAGGQSNPVNQPPSPPLASPSPSPYPTAHLHTMATTASTPGRISITPPWLGAVSVGARVLHHRCHVPFLWKMCFSGRPFLHGIQIFLSGFWVSSRGTDGVSCSMAAREPLGAAGGGLARQVRSSLGSPAEGDRCFICAAPRRDGGDPVPLHSAPLARSLCRLSLAISTPPPGTALERGLVESHVLLCYDELCTPLEIPASGSRNSRRKAD